jgi:hypothetical protein
LEFALFLRRFPFAFRYSLQPARFLGYTHHPLVVDSWHGYQEQKENKANEIQENPHPEAGARENCGEKICACQKGRAEKEESAQKE